jgi:hypothetical protein
VGSVVGTRPRGTGKVPDLLDTSQQNRKVVRNDSGMGTVMAHRG